MANIKLNKMKYPKYQEVRDVIGPANKLISPAEIHGLMSGVLCAGINNLDEGTWDEAGFFSFGTEDLSEAQEAVIMQLFQATKDKITHMEFDYNLFLPDDDESLQVRAMEFGQWCQGFLSGFGLAGGQLDEHEHQDAIESIERISDAANIAYENLEISEEDERAFMEVTEYVRMAVLVVYSDIHKSDGQVTDNESNKKYH